MNLSMRAWTHNSLRGSGCMAAQFLENVLSFNSTTDKAKQMAADIRPLLSDLIQELKIRVDPGPKKED